MYNEQAPYNCKESGLIPGYGFSAAQQAQTRIATAGLTEKVSQVDSKIKELTNQADRVLDKVANLEKRLYSVLIPVPPVPIQAGAQAYDNAVLVEKAAALGNVSSTLQAVLQNLDSIFDRLEL